MQQIGEYDSVLERLKAVNMELEKHPEIERVETVRPTQMQFSPEVREIMLCQPLNPFKQVRFSLLPRVYVETEVKE